jgi:DNA polymerase
MNEVTGDQRQVGKCAVLALGYGGGVGAFQSMAKIYGVKISDSKADDIKVKWRKANSKIVDYWYALENAAIKAVQNKGSKVVAGPTGREVCFKVVGNFLFCRLPSGRFITTPYPHLKYVPTPWGSERLSLFYYGEKEQKFIKMSTYGGKLAENITQAVSADLLRNSLVQCELADFPVTFHVHDEIVCELNENDSRTEKELEKCMEILPPWAKDLPIKAEGWQGKRFRK